MLQAWTLQLRLRLNKLRRNQRTLSFAATPADSCRRLSAGSTIYAPTSLLARAEAMPHRVRTIICLSRSASHIDDGRAYMRDGRHGRWRISSCRFGIRASCQDCEECDTKEACLIESIRNRVTGSLTAEQQAKLMEIAAKCPVHRTLKSEINIRLNAAEKSSAS